MADVSSRRGMPPRGDEPLTNAERLRRQRAFKARREARRLGALVEIAQHTTDEAARSKALAAIMEDGR